MRIFSTSNGGQVGLEVSEARHDPQPSRLMDLIYGIRVTRPMNCSLICHESRSFHQYFVMLLHIVLHVSTVKGPLVGHRGDPP